MHSKVERKHTYTWKVWILRLKHGPNCNKFPLNLCLIRQKVLFVSNHCWFIALGFSGWPKETIISKGPVYVVYLSLACLTTFLLPICISCSLYLVLINKKSKNELRTKPGKSIIPTLACTEMCNHAFFNV